MIDDENFFAYNIETLILEKNSNNFELVYMYASE